MFSGHTRETPKTRAQLTPEEPPGTSRYRPKRVQKRLKNADIGQNVSKMSETTTFQKNGFRARGPLTSRGVVLPGLGARGVGTTLVEGLGSWRTGRAKAPPSRTQGQSASGDGSSLPSPPNNA
jgi:hypothetical protein